jgi:uncharacterized delta-60 repeat protein
MRLLYIFLILVLPSFSLARVGFNRIGYVTNLPNNSSRYRFFIVQPDGKILVVGQTDINNNDRSGLIVRFNPDGTLDTTFNETGFINADQPTNSSSLDSVALQPDGKIVAVGQTDDSKGLIVRFNPSGSLDQTFNEPHGFINTQDDTGSVVYNSVVLQPDGKILVAGGALGGNGLIARFNQNGSLDRTFNTTGFSTNIPNNSFVYNSVALQPDGKILVVGQTDSANFLTDGIIVRFNSDGSLDTTGFNAPNGFINTGNATHSSSLKSFVLQPDGKILVVGIADGVDLNGVNFNGLIARYNSNGSLDETFNTTGFISNIPTNSNS